MEEAPPSIAETNIGESISSDKIFNTNGNILTIDSGECDFTFYKWPDAKYMINSKGDRKYSFKKNSKLNLM